MSLNVRALIADKALLAKACSLIEARVAGLADGLGLLPLAKAAEAAFPPAKGCNEECAAAA